MTPWLASGPRATPPRPRAGPSGAAAPGHTPLFRPLADRSVGPASWAGVRPGSPGRRHAPSRRVDPIGDSDSISVSEEPA